MKKNITLIKSIKNFNSDSLNYLKKLIPELEQLCADNLDVKDSFSLKNHKRSTYKKMPKNGFVSIKGFTGSFEEYETKLSLNENVLGNSNINEMFPALEQKIPYQCLFSELNEEFEKSLEFIDFYIKLYNKLPNIPIPLSLYSYDSDYKMNVVKMLKKHISAFLEPQIDGIMTEDTFAVLKYYYPTEPFRLMDLNEKDPRAQVFWNEDYSIIFSWCDFFVESILIGFIPGTKHFMLKGCALDHQNLLLSGGFSDMGSLVKIGDLNEPVLVESFFFCVKKILNASEFLLGSKVPNVSNAVERGTYLSAKIQEYIFEELRRKSSDLKVSLPNGLEKVLLSSKDDILNNYFNMC